jgi:hypothetical protein
MAFNRNRFSNANRDPRVITAMFDSVCAETGTKISKGAECVYYPTSKSVYSMDSKQATEYRTWKADLVSGFDY